MPTAYGELRVDGLPRDNATVNLYFTSAAFAQNPPQGYNKSTGFAGTPFPADTPVATTTTGPLNGGPGAWRFTDIPSAEYYVGIFFNGAYVWQYYNATNFSSSTSGALILNVNSTLNAKVFEAQRDGTPIFHTGVGPSGGTHYVSGSLGLFGPRHPWTPTTIVAPPALKLKQITLNDGTPSSGATTYINFNDRKCIGMLDNRDVSDTFTSYPVSGYPGGGNSLAFWDLWSESRLIWDADAELRNEVRTGMHRGHWPIFVLQYTPSRESGFEFAPSGVLQNNAAYNLDPTGENVIYQGVGIATGYRTILPGGVVAQKLVELWDSNLSTLTARTFWYGINNGVVRQQMILNEAGGVVFPSSPIPVASGVVAGSYGVCSVGDGGYGFNKFGGSAGGTMYASSAKASFTGNFCDYQYFGRSVFSVAASGQQISTVYDEAGSTTPWILRKGASGTITTIATVGIDGSFSSAGFFKGSGTPTRFAHRQAVFSGANVIASSFVYEGRQIECVGDLAGSDRTLTLPSLTGSEWIVFNNTSTNAVVVTPSGGGNSVTVTALKHCLIYCDSSGNFQKATSLT